MHILINFVSNIVPTYIYDLFNALNISYNILNYFLKIFENQVKNVKKCNIKT